jgi:hypothetical protein
LLALTRDGIIAVCLGALIATPLTIWLHITLSRAGERNRLLGWAAMVSFLSAWLAVITFFITLMLLIAVAVAG